MTAPAAPRIRVNSDGHKLYIGWRPVDTATDYNLYFQPAGESSGIEAQFEDIDINPDGWFFYVSVPLAGVYNVWLTALNAGAEESAASNVVQRNLWGEHDNVQTSAVNHASRMVGGRFS